jgi:hypothetical protein
MDNLDARQIGRQRLALATALYRGDDFFGFSFGFVRLNGRRFDQFLGLVEHGKLRRVRVVKAALRLGREQFMAQQGDLFL